MNALRATAAPPLLLLALLFAGCASAPRPGSKATVSRIEVSYSPKLEGRARELDAVDRVRAGIGAALRRSALHSPDGSLTLRVEITSLRLRGAETARWLGIMAGVDKLGVHVRVLQRAAPVADFSARLDLVAGSSGAPRTSRLTKLVVQVSDEVAEKLQKLDIRDPVGAPVRLVDDAGDDSR